MTTLNKNIWLFFALILFVSIFFRLKIIHELPLGISANDYGLTGFDDEPAHLNYVKYLLEHSDLPVLEYKITDANALIINEFEYHQPPLYYLIIASLSKVLFIESDSSILLLGRYFNFVLTLLSILVLYKILICFSWSETKILTAISIFLLLGSSVYQYSVFGNDGLSWFLFWLLLLFVLKGISKNWILVIAILALSHYTKSSILVFYPIILFSFFYEIKKNGISKKLLGKYFSVFIVPFLISFPWYYRNYLVYGTYFSMSTITGGNWYFVKSLEESIIKLIHMPYLFLFRMHFIPPKQMLSFFNIIPNIWFALAGIFWILKLKSAVKSTYNVKIINLLLISMVGAYLYYAIPTGYTEGRLLYPGLPAILYFMTEVLFTERIKHNFFEGWQLLFVLLIFLPSYIIGFYF